MKRLQDQKFDRAFAGVDWVTFTGKDPRQKSKIMEQASNLADLLQTKGHGPGKHLVQRGGYEIIKWPGFSYGLGPQGYIVTLSSLLASKYWLPFAAYAERCTRIDLQVTFEFKTDPLGLISNEYEGIMGDKSVDGRRNYSLIKNRKGGQTLYVGSRSSTQFGRLYDKSRQDKSGQWVNAVRYEVQFNKPASSEVMRKLMNHYDDEDYIGDLVLSWFERRAVTPPRLPSSLINEIRVQTEQNPFEKKLEWLRSSVRPVVMMLGAAGLISDVEDALGIRQFTTDSYSKGVTRNGER